MHNTNVPRFACAIALKLDPRHWTLAILTVIVLTSVALTLPASAEPGLVPSASATVANTDGDGLNLREAPTISAAVIAVMPEGATVDVRTPASADADGITWAAISYQGISGYAAELYLAPVPGEPPPPPPTVQEPPAVPGTGGSAPDAVVVSGTGGDGLNVRTAPGTDASIITVLAEGAGANIVGGPSADANGDAWYQVDAAGTVGWVFGGYLAGIDTTVGARIVDEALAYLGAPYVWAGTTPDGFDCSGYVYWVMNRVLGSDGNDFPRAMEAQIEQGYFVSAADLQPGDLVFHENTYQPGLSHVGIYIGAGQFVSAVSEESGVAIRTLWDPYWDERYVGARRVTN